MPRRRFDRLPHSRARVSATERVDAALASFALAGADALGIPVLAREAEVEAALRQGAAHELRVPREALGVLGLLIIERHGAAAALAFVTLGLTVGAELFRLGPFGVRGYAMVVALCWVNTGALATRYVVRPARARRRERDAA